MTTQVSKPRLALFVDNVGAAELWPAIGTLAPVCALVAAGIRPQYIESLSALADEMGCSLLIQPRHDAPTYAGFVQQLAQTAPTRILVHSYSMILRPDVLSLVDYDALNIHAALLPRNRGPNPVQWALIHDEAETGVTLHYLDDGLDTGISSLRSGSESAMPIPGSRCRSGCVKQRVDSSSGIWRPCLTADCRARPRRSGRQRRTAA